MTTPTDVENWEDFFKAFEIVFRHDWPTTLTKFGTIGDGTFLQPQSSEYSPTWQNRDALLAAYRKIRPKVELAAIAIQKLRDERRNMKLGLRERFSRASMAFFSELTAQLKAIPLKMSSCSACS